MVVGNLGKDLEWDGKDGNNQWVQWVKTSARWARDMPQKTTEIPMSIESIHRHPVPEHSQPHVIIFIRYVPFLSLVAWWTLYFECDSLGLCKSSLSEAITKRELNLTAKYPI